MARMNRARDALAGTTVWHEPTPVASCGAGQGSNLCNRDTAWYSILDSKWPRIRANFEAWLACGSPKFYPLEIRQGSSHRPAMRLVWRLLVWACHAPGSLATELGA